MNEEELCERICQLEKELKEEKEKNKRIEDKTFCIGRRYGKSHELKMVLEEYISKDKIRDLIAERKFELQQEYEDFENDIKLKILQELLEE